MKKTVFLLAIFFALNSCNREELQNENSKIEMVQKDPLTEKQINERINQAIKTDGSFNWKNESDHFVWSAVFRGNKMVSIGFGSSKDDFDRSKSPDNQEMEKELLSVIKKYEGKDERNFIMLSDRYLNQMDVIIEKEETIAALRQMKTVRYLEPGDYHYFENESKYNTAEKSSGSGSSGCGFSSTALNTADYTSTTPGAKIPWAFTKHNIPDAWSYSTGAGVTIGLIDTGVSPEQVLLGEALITELLREGPSANWECITQTVREISAAMEPKWPQ